MSDAANAHSAYFKLYLCFAGSISILSLIAQSVPALGETSEPDAVSPIMTTEAVSQEAGGQGCWGAGENVHKNRLGVVCSLASASLPHSETLPAPTVQEGQQNTDSDAPMAQVTSVSQLGDVQPTDWAFQALQSLVERYGCIAGYPDGTFRGNRALTRYEFAAGLNACLDRVNELIAAPTSDLFRQEDIATTKRLQAEFAPELAALRGRLDMLEARSAELEANQFSTTTKLSGQVIFAVNGGAFSGDRIVDPRGAVITNQQPNPTFLYRASLDLNTSFSGTDLLKLRLDSVSARGGDNAGGFLEPYFGSVFEFTVRGTPDTELGISRLYYTFTPFKDFSLTVGPAIVTTDYIDINSYANGNGIDFSTLALVNNYLLFPVNGPSAGAVLNWNPGQGPFKVRALYAAADAANPNPNNQRVVGSVFPFARLLYPDGGGDRGLFGSPYQGTVELEYSLSKAFAVRLQYSGGNVFDGRFDVFGANVELALNKQLAVFGRYGYSNYNNTAFGDIHPNYWMAGVSLRNLFVPGAVAGVAAGQPFIDNAVGNATQTNVEGFYNFPLSDNIQVTPLIQLITNPANQDSNGTIVTGSVRTVFSF